MLEELFAAQRVAVTGVSKRPGNLGLVVLDNLKHMQFQGEVFAVGREKAETEYGPIYASVDDVPGRLDLGIVMVPAPLVAETLDAFGRNGVRRVVVSSGGFGELGNERGPLEAEILAVAHRHGIRFLGPNCLGVADCVSGLMTSFAPVPLWTFNKGPVSIISQSGGIANAMAGLISELGAGLNKFISMGNKLDVDEADCLAYLAQDPSTEVICFYLEDIRRGRRLMEVARTCRKPILVHKANASESGARVARSHTAALASDERIVDAALAQAGMVRVSGVRNMAMASGVVRLPKMKGNRIAAMCLSGGVSVILADLAESLCFTLPELDQDLLHDFEERGRSGIIKLTNPLDMGDFFDAGLFMDIMKGVISLPYIDGMVVVCPLGGGQHGTGFRGTYESAIPLVKEICRKLQKPIVLSNMPGSRSVTDLMHQFEFPLFADPEDATRALAVLHRYSMLSR